MSGNDIGTSDVPMHVLAGVGGLPILGLLIDLGSAGEFVRGKFGRA